jgi:hypothetical protein
MEKNMRKIAVVTTFHEEGLKKYAQKMIDTFSNNWPKEIILYLYPENCDPKIVDSSRTIITDLNTVRDLTIFKEKWKNVPKANGDVSNDPVRSRRKDAGKGFKWHAVRFAHKVYAIFDCAKKTDADVLLWMDADTICHSPITYQQISDLIPEDIDLCYLGRKGKYSECGLYSLNLKSEMTRNFLREFQRFYDQAENGIFTLDEWHDSFVFDAVRRRFTYLKQLDWAADLNDIRPGKFNSQGEGHPLINSQWGAYLDHLKGERKSLGRSKKEDLKIKRTESYWL